MPRAVTRSILSSPSDLAPLARSPSGFPVRNAGSSHNVVPNAANRGRGTNSNSFHEISPPFGGPQHLLGGEAEFAFVLIDSSADADSLAKERG